MKRRALHMAATAVALFATSNALADEAPAEADPAPVEVAEPALFGVDSDADEGVIEGEEPSAQQWWEVPLRSDGYAARCECQKGDPLCGCLDIDEPIADAGRCIQRDALISFAMPELSE